MEINLSEEINAIKKRLKKQYLIVGVLGVFIVLTIVLTLLLQTRDTQTLFIIGGSIVLWLLVVTIWFMIFSFIKPEKKWLKVVQKAQTSGLKEIICQIKEDLSKSFEDGFFVRRYETQSEAGILILKVEDSLDFNLEVGKIYKLRINSRFVFGVEEQL
ncbi:MAG: hypothetical protein J1F32_07050 [Erysipelotrichales bacterium]|nr:hypothetical protein [Erysipelotrichales bacterium]